MTLLTAGALIDPRLPATASNVCTTDARLGGVGRVPPPPPNPGYAGAPGMSDHEAVTFEVNINPIRNRKPPHKVFKYKSADWCKLKNEISKLTDEYFDSDPKSQDVSTNLTLFGDNLTTLMNNTIPHCNTKAKTHLPSISRELIRMQRRRNKSHKKAKQTGLNKHWEHVL